MGAGPSLAKALEAMDDEQLIAIVEQGYRVDAARVERIFAVAQTRHLQSGGVLPATSNASESVLGSLGQSPAVPVLHSTTPTVLIPSAQTLSSSPDAVAVGTNTSMPVPDESAVGGPATVDRMAALWTFQGHTLRQLRSGLSSKKRAMPGADTTVPPDAGQEDASMVDADGYPVLSGSCGREKKYARCSVCYFRGVRCNTSYYCACCQRPVCVRPRTYPGEEHPKICWNVLHVDKDMIQRVDKRRARKLHAASLLPDKALGSEEDEDAPLLIDAKKAEEDEQDEPSPAKQRNISEETTPSSSEPLVLVKASVSAKPVDTT